MIYQICIDIGGTTFSFIIFDKSEIFYRSEIFDIKKYQNHTQLIKELTSKIKKIINLDNIKNIGIACPGPLNFETGEILNTPNLKILQYVNLKEEIYKYINCSDIKIDNDANVYTLGAFKRIKNKKDSDVILGITLGTGIGFGFVLNGKIFRGSYGMAGEYELSPLSENKNWSHLLGYKFFKEKTKYTPKELFLLSEENDEKSKNIWKEYGINLGLCLTHVISIINPNYISIGGGISKANKYFHEDMLNILNKCIIFDQTKIEINYDNLGLNIFYGNLINENINSM